MSFPATRRALLEAAAVGIAYYASARLALLLQLPGTNASAIWPSSGIGLAALLLLGKHVWPGIAVAAFFANILTLPMASPVVEATMIAIGNTLEQLMALALIRRVSGTANPFDRARHALGYVGATVLAGLFAATVGVTTLHLTGVIDAATYRAAWMTWLIGDIAGMVVLAPAIYAWGRQPRIALPSSRRWELAALMVLAVITGEMIFGNLGTVQVALARPYQPLLLWAAFRFGQRETSTLAVIATAQAVTHVWLAITSSATAVGPVTALSVLFVGSAAGPQEWLQALQFFLCSTVVVGLVVAAAVAERDRSQRLLAVSEQRYRTINQTLEQRVRERTALIERTNEQLESQIHERLRAELQLRASLEEKETLLREVHHRVKNNLSVVSSLLYFEERAARDPRTSEFLAEAQHRVRSMAMVHEELYRSGSLADIDLRQYFERLSAYLSQSYPIASRRVVIDVRNIDAVSLDADTAIPCGLIFTELVTNAFKHGYPTERSGTIAVSVRLKDGRCTLTVADDGPGIQGEPVSDTSSTLGLRLVHVLARQLGGVFAFAPTEVGTEAVLDFPLPALVNT